MPVSHTDRRTSKATCRVESRTAPRFGVSFRTPASGIVGGARPHLLGSDPGFGEDPLDLLANEIEFGCQIGRTIQTKLAQPGFQLRNPLFKGRCAPGCGADVGIHLLPVIALAGNPECGSRARQNRWARPCGQGNDVTRSSRVFESEAS